MTFRNATTLTAVFLFSLLGACDLPEGTEAGPCFSNGTCNDSLQCLSDLCVSTDTSPDTPTTDAPTTDAPTPDAPTPDAPMPDAPTPDAPTPDAPTPDASSPDTPIPTPESSPDTSAPEPDPSPETCGSADVISYCTNQLDVYICENGQTGVFDCNTYCISEGAEEGDCMTVTTNEATCNCRSAAPPSHAHGDLCTTVADCGFPSSGLTCVIENQGDDQGLCRRVCGSFSECLNDPVAMSMFDTSCCDVTNGSSVCANSLQWDTCEF